MDFGKNWKGFQDASGVQNWFAGFHPSDTTLIFYSGEMPFAAGFIYRSADNGLTWSYYTTDIDNCVHHIAFHPNDANILVWSGEGRIAKSTDKGINWRVIQNEYLWETGMYFYKILFDEENPDYLYATGINGKTADANDSIFTRYYI